MARFCKTLQSTCRANWIVMLLTLVMAAFTADAYAQRQVVSGKVVDTQGQPIVGATIIESGTTNGTTTNVQGEFSLQLRGGGEFR